MVGSTSQLQWSSTGSHPTLTAKSCDVERTRWHSQDLEKICGA